MKRLSQNDQILELLAGGQWVGHHRLYEIGCVAHSRIAELRSRGHEIEQRRTTINGRPVWEYRMVAPLRSPSERPSFPYLQADRAEQLTLDSAA
jgi:hypothetical protein